MRPTFERTFRPSQNVVLVHGGAGFVPEASRKAHADGCLRAARAGAEVLKKGGVALDAVCEAVRLLEDDPSFNAGTGACLDETGHLALDAAVMDGDTLRAGALACLPAFANPVQIARRLLDVGGPVLLAAEGARLFALSEGFVPADEKTMITELARHRLEEARLKGESAGFAGGTVGAVARDRHGHVAAATSTGGKTNKRFGRVGDSPLIGAGTYADDTEGATSATGDGEAFIRLVLARHACSALVGPAAEHAARDTIDYLAQRLAAQGGLILVSRDGAASLARNTVTMGYAVVTDDLEEAGA